MSIREELEQYITEPSVVAEVPTLPENYLPDNVHVHIHQGMHLTAEHFESGRDFFEKADVYIPESAGWSPKILKEINAISKGDRKKYLREVEYQKGSDIAEYQLAKLGAIYRSYKPILFADIQKGDPRDIPYWVTFDKYAKLYDGTVPGTIMALTGSVDEIARTAVIRDAIIVENLGKEVTALLARHHKLAAKPEVKVLVTLGDGHKNVFDALTNNPQTKNRVSGSTLYRDRSAEGMNPQAEFTRMYTEGEKPMLEHVAQSLLIDTFRSPIANSDGLPIMALNTFAQVRHELDANVVRSLTSKDLDAALKMAARLLQPSTQRVLLDEERDLILRHAEEDVAN